MAFGERKESGEGLIWCHLSSGLAGANQSFEREDPKYFFNSLSQYFPFDTSNVSVCLDHLRSLFLCLFSLAYPVITHTHYM